MTDVDTISLAQVKSKALTWLWDRYIPSGAVTMCFGDGGVGKSFLSLAIAAAVTRGWPLPGEEQESKTPGNVIVQNAENALPTVVKPRLELLGADCERVHCINESEHRLTLSDERIEAAIVKHDAKLMILDPVQAYLGGAVSMNRAESVRLVLTQLAQMAERTKCAILLAGHLNKAGGAKANYRGLGSVDMFNSVPSVLYLGKPDDDDERVMVQGKNNLTEVGPSLMFRLSKADGFEWLGECDTTLEELLAKKTAAERDRKRAEAAEFLQDILSEGEIAAVEIVEMGLDNGFSESTLKRAKRSIGGRSRKEDGAWFWYMP